MLAMRSRSGLRKSCESSSCMRMSKGNVFKIKPHIYNIRKLYNNISFSMLLIFIFRTIMEIHLLNAALNVMVMLIALQADQLASMVSVKIHAMELAVRVFVFKNRIS